MNPTNSPTLLDDPIAFWDQRHGEQDELRSGGDIGLSTAENEMFYAVRLGSLLQLIGDAADTDAPLFVLDAGCGKGYFSETLTRCGHRVVAFDSSETAVEEARATGAAQYEVDTLDNFTYPWLFDVVYGVDVLFHILDDEIWRKSVLNLAAHVRLGGKLIITDVHSASRKRLGNYIVNRAINEYTEALSEAGFSHLGFKPYNFRQNQNGFHVFQRIG